MFRYNEVKNPVLKYSALAVGIAFQDEPFPSDKKFLGENAVVL